MESPVGQVPGSGSNRWRRAFSGTRGLLIVTVLFALGLGWLTQAYREAERQTAIVSGLKQIQVYSRFDEPTGLALIVKKFLPGSERSLRDRIGSGWFDRPTIFFGQGFQDHQNREIVAQLRQLGTVREIHYDGPGLTDAGLAQLRDGLPGVNVVPNFQPDLHRYFLATAKGEHFAYPAAIFGGTVAVGLLVVGFVLGRWMVRRLGAVRRNWGDRGPESGIVSGSS